MRTFEDQIDEINDRYLAVTARVPSLNRTPIHWTHIGAYDKLMYLLQATVEHVNTEETCLVMGDNDPFNLPSRKAELSAYKFHAGLLAGAMLDQVEMMEQCWPIGMNEEGGFEFEDEETE